MLLHLRSLPAVRQDWQSPAWRSRGLVGFAKEPITCDQPCIKRLARSRASPTTHITFNTTTFPATAEDVNAVFVSITRTLTITSNAPFPSSCSTASLCPCPATIHIGLISSCWVPNRTRALRYSHLTPSLPVGRNKSPVSGSYLPQELLSAEGCACNMTSALTKSQAGRHEHVGRKFTRLGRGVPECSCPATAYHCLCRLVPVARSYRGWGARRGDAFASANDKRIRRHQVGSSLQEFLRPESQYNLGAPASLP